VDNPSQAGRDHAQQADCRGDGHLRNLGTKAWASTGTQILQISSSRRTWAGQKKAGTGAGSTPAAASAYHSSLDVVSTLDKRLS